MPIHTTLQMILLTFIKFSLVGVLGLVFDFGLTFLCKEKLKINKYISNTLGFTVAATSNWALNRIWTFHSTNPEILAEYLHYLCVSAMGLALSTITIWLLSDKARVNFYLSKAVGVIVTTVTTFIVNMFFTFG